MARVSKKEIFEHWQDIAAQELVDFVSQYINKKRTIKVYGKTTKKESKARRTASGRKSTSKKTNQKITAGNKKTTKGSQLSSK